MGKGRGMARTGKGAQLVRRALLLAVTAWIFAGPTHSRSNTAGAQEPTAKPNEVQEPKPTPAEPKADQAEPGSADAATPDAATSPTHEATREEQIESQTKELFRLSAEMRAEVAKTYKDTLSLAVLKKAEQIEKVAKSLKALMDADIADNKHKNQ
jgi:hypothetical protein